MHHFENRRTAKSWRCGCCSETSRSVLHITGEWNNDKRHGRGICKFADGVKFRGEWEEDGWVQTATEPSQCRAAGTGLHQSIAGESATFQIEVNAFGSQICGPPEVSASAVASLMSETCTGLHQSIAGESATFQIEVNALDLRM